MFTTNIYIKGIIKDIQFSHTSNNKQYDKALIEIDENNLIPIKFREDMLSLNNIKENDCVSTQGTIRTYSKQIYIHTNLSHTDIEDEQNCLCKIEGAVVKKYVKFGSYILQNDTNTFIPVKSDNDYQINDNVCITGYLIARKYIRKKDGKSHITYEVVEIK